jgi:hypothetical protein
MAEAYALQTAQDHHHGMVETSIDLLRKSKFHTTSIVGSERGFDQYHATTKTTSHTVADCSADAPLALHQYKCQSLPLARLSASSIEKVPLVPESMQNNVHPRDFSQRKHLASTPGPNQNPLLSLSHP